MNVIAFEAPPAPIIIMFLSFNEVYFSIDTIAPIPSVLYPFAIPSLKFIVFTAPIFSAVSSISSRYGIMVVLCGIVTFKPLIFKVFADVITCFRFSTSTWNGTYL